MAKKKAFLNLEDAPAVATISPEERLKQLRELEFRRLSLAAAAEVVLDDYRKAGGAHAPRRRARAVGKAPNDYRK